jgi:TIR domain
MTGADGSPDPGARPGWRWDVALSFASAQRHYVEQVAGALTARGLRCFFDADEQVELWGRYLAEELPAIYAEQAAAVVVFISAEYAAHDWTRLERRAALNRAARERREYVLPTRFDDTPLPGLLSDMVAVDLRTRTPQQLAAMIADKLARLAITASAPPRRVGDSARDVEPAPWVGAVRAGDVDPRQLGVHAAISVPGVPDEVPPEYVPRDVDTAGSGVQAKVGAAAERGGFVLLIGGSSVGKTRSAAEAVRALLPDWWLVHPAGPDQLAALAQVPFPRMVVWLDELQRYLDGEHGLTGAVVRALLNGPHPAVIIGTLWPDRYTAYTTLPAPGGTDPHARERQVLDLADVVRIAPAFSPAEQDRARAAATQDPRLQVALESAGYGLTQTLAAAPQLVARWQDAQTAAPYAWAVLTAALDVVRFGARVPLSVGFLRAAAPGYLTSQQQAEAPRKWFKQALAYATTKRSRGPPRPATPAARRRAAGAAGCTRPPSPSRCRSRRPARDGAGTPRLLLAARESSALSRDPPGASYP